MWRGSTPGKVTSFHVVVALTSVLPVETKDTPQSKGMSAMGH